MNHTATYDPGDNKLRLYPGCRLPEDEYQRVKAAGFRWAPKQELFVAPSWSPEREDLLLEMCGGEIGDEDTSLVERAESKAERLDELAHKRAEEAHSAKAAVERITDGIPLGQPILVGHHSEKHARKDAERIENGMRKAVNCWQASKYWKDRAAGALRAAKYKERPDVRFRRIKGIEADLRKTQKTKTDAEMRQTFWTGDVTRESAVQFCNCHDHTSRCFPLADYPRNPPASQYEGLMSLWSALGGSDGPEHAVITVDQARDLALAGVVHTIERCDRWIEHYENRLAYERAMLDEQGGLTAEQFDLAIGGQVLYRGDWYTITKINRRDGQITSVSTGRRSWPSTIEVERIRNYRPPAEGAAETVAAATKLPPICNYPGEGFIGITQEQWNGIHKDYKGTHGVAATEKYGRHRIRQAMAGPLRARGVNVGEGVGYGNRNVWITDAKRKDPPAASESPSPVSLPRVERDLPTLERRAAAAQAQREPDADAAKFAAMEDSLRAGVEVVTAPCLFPTPPDVAKRVVDLARIYPGHDVLEPSAGTGALLAKFFHLNGNGRLCAVEINRTLADHLRGEYPTTDVRCGDFLECNADLGMFDRILMNPPFDHGADIKHVEHARKFLKPGGRLVAIVAAGPREHQALVPIASDWIPLPDDTFKAEGTAVRTAIVVIDA
jgi:protein-L-isoaspartate O-methyltransferase